MPRQSRRDRSSRSRDVVVPQAASSTRQGVVVTTIQALGGEDGLRVRGDDGNASDAELAGWDPTTSLAVLKASALAAPPIAVAKDAARVGHLALAVARSWSNGLTASAGIVSIIGGPLPTGRRRSIHEVIRTTAPMHDGLCRRRVRRYRRRARGHHDGVDDPRPRRRDSIRDRVEDGAGSARAWTHEARLHRHCRPARATSRRTGRHRRSAPCVAGRRRHAEGPAAQAGVIVGDIILALDGHPIGAPEDLLDLLAGRSRRTDRKAARAPWRLADRHFGDRRRAAGALM